MEYKDIDGNPISLERLCRTEPSWAANRIWLSCKRIAELKKQLREVKEYHTEECATSFNFMNPDACICGVGNRNARIDALLGREGSEEPYNMSMTHEQAVETLVRLDILLQNGYIAAAPNGAYGVHRKGYIMHISRPPVDLRAAVHDAFHELMEASPCPEPSKE